MPSRRTVVLALAFLVLPSAALAQIGLLANGVVVTPDGDSVTVVTNGAYSTAFGIWNSSSSTDTYDLVCSATGPVTCGSILLNGVPIEGLNLKAGQSRSLTVEYTTGGTTGGRSRSPRSAAPARTMVCTMSAWPARPP